VNVVKGGRATEWEQVKVAKIATVAVGLLAIVLGIVFKGQNVAFMVGLAFAVACSANFPALLLSITWRRLSTAGATASIIVGSVLATVLIILSPTVWVEVLNNPTAIFPLKNPAIVSMTVSFITAFVVSLLFADKEAEEKFNAQKVRTYLALGAE
ncbi:MAG: cation acetate symporter, partial [Thermoanaerobacteraceae bacterium]|nr:cation acetate symporter [Thermoanaerobacteraceae bacterium]